MIRGELVSLRPLTAADLERAERVANDPEYNGPFRTFALAADGDVRGRFELDGDLNHDPRPRAPDRRRRQWRARAWRDVSLYSKLRS